MADHNEKAPRKARRSIDRDFIWAGIKGAIYGILLSKKERESREAV